jgi:hypothetical protein
MKLRVWAEYFTPLDAMKKEVRELLKKYNVNLCIATPYGCLNEEWANFLKTYQEEKIEVTLWLLLSDELGYWPSERNVDEFSEYIDSIFEFAKKYNIQIPCIAIDLETPIYQANKILSEKGFKKIFTLLKIYRENKNRERFYYATKKYSEILEKIHRNNTTTIVAAIPWIIEDVVAKNIKIQDILETPVTEVDWDVISFMIYNSMFVGYSKGFLSFEDARYLLYLYAKKAKENFKERAGISVGVTSIGKLGNEPYYETPGLLKPDIEVVKSAGIEDIAIYNLEGILKSKNPEEWFEIVINATPKIPPSTLKIKILRKIVRTILKII